MRRLRKMILTVLLAVVMLMVLRLLPGQRRVAEQPARLLPDGTTGLVVRVVDGDTLKVRTNAGQLATIRVLGIDCPESRNNSKCQRDAKHGRHGCRWQVPLGKRAKSVAKRILNGATVTLECGKKCRRGSYGRFLRYVELKNGVDFGLQMLQLGLCEDFGWKYPHQRSNSYRQIQAVAKRTHKGIWQSP